MGAVDTMLHTLAQLNILHTLIGVLRAFLIIVFVIQMILGFALRGQDNRFYRIFRNITGPIVDPFERLIPPLSLGGVSLSLGFIAGWWSVTIATALLGQALPSGW